MIPASALIDDPVQCFACGQPVSQRSSVTVPGCSLPARQCGSSLASSPPDNPPLYVWIEQPAGKPRPHPSLIEMVGVTKEAVYGVLSTLYPFPVTVAEVPVATWKKHGIGHGNADKDAVMAWAQTVGDPANQDEADALGIAFGGLAMMGSQGAAAA